MADLETWNGPRLAKRFVGASIARTILIADRFDGELRLLTGPLTCQPRPVTRRGWYLFVAMAFIWGIPYLLIRVAVRQLEPAMVVFGRTSIAALVLLLIAHRADAIRPALRHWRPIVAFAIIEMAIPWVLLAIAEQHLASGLTGLIVATVPLLGALTAFFLGDRAALSRVRVAGMVIGFTGVAFLVGNDLTSDSAPPWWSVAMVLLVCICYATAPFIIDRKLADVPSFGVIALSLALVALIYAPIAAVSLPQNEPTPRSVLAVVALALVCTGLAFVVFFKLLAEVGPARAPLITFANPVVAVSLGAVFLDELVTGVTVVGFALVMTGCWLGTRAGGSAVAVAPIERHHGDDLDGSPLHTA